MDIQTEIKSAIDSYKVEKKQLSESMQEVLKDTYKYIFDTYPDVKSFSWLQYTPYFNDGDTCEFTVYDYPYINGYCEYEYDEQEGNDMVNFYINSQETVWDSVARDSKPNPNFNPEHKAVIDIINALFEMPREIFKDAYGDHVEVTVTREGVEVEEYDHD